jgi:putative IMPACT (imprinted ancient) family translation regulator
MSAYKSIAAPASARLEIKRSVFVAELIPVRDDDSAFEEIRLAARRHPKANHRPYAMVIGPGGTLRRSSDDGEPQGTSARPIMGVIDSHAVSDVLLIVSRYFGGVKLGAPGLARAYAGAAGSALEDAAKIERRLCCLLETRTTYQLLGRTLSALESLECPVEGVDYLDGPVVRFYVESERRNQAEEALSLIHGREASVSKTDEKYVDFKE